MTNPDPEDKYPRGVVEPFIPRVLRTEQGTVAVELHPAYTSGVLDLFQVCHAGPDFRATPLIGLPWRTCGMTEEMLVEGVGLVFVELTP